MGIVTMIKAIKKIHEKDIVFVRIGKFFHIYGKDSFIVAYIFDYKLKQIEGVYTCGFPMDSMNKIRAKLEEKKVNYLIVDRKNNYEVEDVCDFKNLNNYDKIFQKAKPLISIKIRIGNINEYLLNNIDNKSIDLKELVKELEEVIDERRKISGN